jgi:alanyl-tRNA synthetase/misacylated tRNA(Ala) deacylase
VELEDTVIFPEGGGQPWDTGVLRLHDANGDAHEYQVEACIRRGLDAVHRVRVPDASAIDFATLSGSSATPKSAGTGG